MEKDIDLLILNNCPAFYKINLYNEIALKKKIFVIFIGYYDQVVIDEDFKNNIKFPYVVLNETSLSQRNIFRSFRKLRNVMKGLNYKRIIYGGYIDPEFILTSFLTPKSKNILQTESAGETKLSGPRFFLKKILLKRYDQALASGRMHEKMLQKMSFDKKIIITKGVGIINKKIENKDPISNINDQKLKFLYVGRLIDLKNLKNLVEVFNNNGLALTIVGKGELELELKTMSNTNITFLGFIENKDLVEVYKSHNVFILPSLSEAWGLVVEEALYRSCALVLSERVGCLQELLIDHNTGTSFNPEDTSSMQDAIDKVIKNYSLYNSNANNFDLNIKDAQQVSAYTEDIFRS